MTSKSFWPCKRPKTRPRQVEKGRQEAALFFKNPSEKNILERKKLVYNAQQKDGKQERKSLPPPKEKKAATNRRRGGFLQRTGASISLSA